MWCMQWQTHLQLQFQLKLSPSCLHWRGLFVCLLACLLVSLLANVRHPCLPFPIKCNVFSMFVDQKSPFEWNPAGICNVCIYSEILHKAINRTKIISTLRKQKKNTNQPTIEKFLSFRFFFLFFVIYYCNCHEWFVHFDVFPLFVKQYKTVLM